MQRSDVIILCVRGLTASQALAHTAKVPQLPNLGTRLPDLMILTIGRRNYLPLHGDFLDATHNNEALS